MSNTFRWAYAPSMDWGNANSWTVGGSPTTLVPGATDTVDFYPPGSTTDDPTPITVSGGGQAASVAITNASVTFSGSGVYQFGALAIGSTVQSAPATLAFGALSATSLEIGSTGSVPLNDLTIDLGSTVTAIGYADIVPSVLNAGTIDATRFDLTLGGYVTNSGTIEANGGSVTISGALANTGTLLAANGTVTLGGGIVKAGTLEIGSSGVLALDDFSGTATVLPVEFVGVGGALQLSGVTTTDHVGVAGFAIGDTLQVNGSSLTNPTYVGVSNAGQEVNQAGTLTVGSQTFNLTNTEAGIEFQAQTVGGNTVITAAADTFSFNWSYTGSDVAYWSDIANWTVQAADAANVTAPGAANSVNFTGADTTVSGGGAANIISVTGGLTLTDGTYTASALSDGTTSNTASSAVTLNGAHLTTSGPQGVQVVNGSLTVENGGTISAPDNLALIGVGASSHTVALSVTGGSSVQTGSLGIASFIAGSTIDVSVDATSSIEDGTAGGAAAGSITVDSGVTLVSGNSGTTDLSGKVVDNGTIQINNPLLTITGALAGAGSVNVAGGSTFVLDGTGAAGNSISLAAGSSFEVGASATNKPFGVASTISGFTLGSGTQIELADTTLTQAVYTAGSGGLGTLALYDGSTVVEHLTLNGNYTGDSFALSTSGGTASVVVEAAVCYVRGTLIRTARGDVAIEHLRRGDRVLTAAGDYRPVQWLGHRQVDCAGAPNPRDVWPIRVAPHAFGENLPDRDLYLSPGHSVRIGCIEAALVPIVHLINGASIARHPVAAVEYWHVELDRHDVILANNLPAESYIDMNNRDFFIDRGLREYQPAEPVLPVLHSGPMVDLARDQLRARAERLGWTHDKDPAPRLWVDGVEQAPSFPAVGIAQFELAALAREVRLVSTTFVPADLTGATGDPRQLGLSVHGIELRDGDRSLRIALDDAHLDNPHAVERNGDRAWRWTDGSLTLPPALWAPLDTSSVTLRIAFDESAVRGYVAPYAVTGAAAASAVRLAG